MSNSPIAITQAVEAKTYWVTCTDKTMSNWGKAKNKINKLVFECVGSEANRVHDNLLLCSNFIRVNICTTKPYYDRKRYYVQHKTKETYPFYYR